MQLRWKLEFEVKLKLSFSQVQYFLRWVGGWVGGVEKLRIKLSQLSTKLKLKLKLSLAIRKIEFVLYLNVLGMTVETLQVMKQYLL